MRDRIVTAVLLAVVAMAPSEAQEPKREVPGAPAIALHLAALQGDVAAIRAHAEAGSDLDRRDSFGSTPLLVAATFGHPEAVRALLQGGADPTVGNPEGSTPLHVAAFLGRDRVVAALLEQGAEAMLRNDDGATPYDLAVGSPARDRPLLDQLRAGLTPLGLELPDEAVAAGRAAALTLLGVYPPALPRDAFAPEPGGRWPVSTPEARGLDSEAIGRLYAEAQTLEAIYGLLIVKDGHLLAERYFNDGARDRPALLQSVTKSVTSALVGIALERGCLTDLDQRMVTFFPEYADRLDDPRKADITLREMLQMRAGYGWEGSDSLRWEGLIGGDYLPLLVDFPLERDPGSGFDYSNITSHLLGVVVARACETDLLDFAEKNLFGPLEIEPGSWLRDPHGYRYGHAELSLTARDAARFGQLYLDRGMHDDSRVVPAAWVEASLTGYSRDIDTAGLRAGTVGRYFHGVEYGFQWWSAVVGERRFDFAWGHGGQLIVLLDDLDMVVVVTSDPFHRPIREDGESWTHEQANFNLVGRFLRSLPDPGSRP